MGIIYIIVDNRIEEGTMPRRHPLTAARALRQLIANPEDTEKVFVIVRSLSGDSIERGHARFAKTEFGARVLRNRQDLLRVLCDREALRQLPERSLGREYLAFVERAGITAEGLVAASEQGAPELHLLGESEAHYARRLRDMHDLWHVVCGFSTQPFGEVCVVAFSYAQTRNLGLAAIALIGALKIARESGDRSVLRAAWQAYRIGRRAAWFPGQDWEGLLAKPIDEVRSELGVLAPTRYQAIVAGWQSAAHQPA